MNIQNFIKFKKKIGQNYLIFFNLQKFNLCSGFNDFKNYNDIDYLKNCYIKNINYLNKKKIIYDNFLFFNFNINNKFYNINIPFNIITFFIKKIIKIKIFYFKIIIEKINYFTKIGKILKIKLFKNKFFFPIPNIKIKKIYLKKYNFINNKIKNIIFLTKKIKYLKLEKIKSYIKNIIFIIYKNVLFNKI